MGEEDYRLFIGQIDSHNINIQIFSLFPNIKTSLSNRGNRKLTDHELNRIKEQYYERGEREFLGQKIENSSMNATETARYILSVIESTK